MSRFDHFLERATSMAKRNGLTAILSGQTLTLSKPGADYVLQVSPARMPCNVNLSCGEGEPSEVKWMSLEAACRQLNSEGAE